MTRTASDISLLQDGPEVARRHAPRRGLSLLLVGMDAAARDDIDGLLNSRGARPCHIDSVPHLADAVRAAAADRYDAILLPSSRPGSDAKAIQAIGELIEGVPVLMVGEAADDDIAVQALRAGAQDYLVRGATDRAALIRAIRYAAERKRSEQRLQAMASYDTLTGLPNRELLLDRLAQAIAQATRQQTMVALLLLDLDRFKLVNDTLGHAFGDKLLRAVSQRVRGSLRQSDTLARLGGDEFVVVLNGIADASDAAKVAHKIIGRMSRPFDVDGHELFVTTSIGISLFPNDGLDKNTLITDADIAMYRAKEHGRNHYQFYTFGMNTTTVERLTLENDLRRAIERDELLLHYQPQMDIATGRIVGMEALVRWQHPELGLVPPARFIPVAEETGLIVPIGEWVLRRACTQAKAWASAGADPAVMSVNLSSRQFHQEQMLKMVTSILDEAGLDAGRLALEITESSLMLDPDDAVVTLCLLHNMGIGVSIDDFGTGYSSLGHLKRFPLDSLKIDRAFIENVTENPEDAAIVRAILAMAHSLRLKVVAEGVETERQLAFLRDVGCDEIQGYFLSKPLPAPDFAARFLAPSGRS